MKCCLPACLPVCLLACLLAYIPGVTNGGLVACSSARQNALREFEVKKKNEISRVCHRHYSEFIDSVEELMKMTADMVSIKDQVQTI